MNMSQWQNTWKLLLLESQNEMGAEIVLERKGINISHRLEGLGSLLGNVLGTRLNYQRDPYVHS